MISSRKAKKSAKSEKKVKRKVIKNFIQVKNITKNYSLGEVEVKALDNVSVSINRGEIVSIVGHSGSGKTTLLNLIGALDYIDSGTIIIDGQDLSKMNDRELSFLRRETIGYVFQNFNLLEEINAEKNIEMPLILSKKLKEERRAKVEKLLESVGLLERRNHKPDQLSGGEQQRVAIARALANDPDIILADEPTGNLDSTTGEKILKLLIDLSKEYEKTLVYVTHDKEQATLASRQLIMTDGVIAKDFSE
ncbi:MAG: ABC transporter ATP-binding protein [Candidatus Heimdallarchaeota archaeon]|nr:ABC transporter ATP-binding protein [Candidatus Heimdallarchaeota archaeon]